MATEQLSVVGQPAPPSQSGFDLNVVGGPDEGLHFELSKDSVLVGTGTHAEVVLTDSAVSREHIRISLTPAGARVADLGSTNGTRLAGMRTEGFLVREQATFRIGRSVLQLRAKALATPAVDSLGDAVTANAHMRRIFGTVRQVAKSNVPVVFVGETGTGKEALARAIHQESTRASKPFVVVDCSRLAADLIEAELFGHVKGSFTGATGNRGGLLVQADGGTVFFDELGELPVELQTRFLRFLTDGMVRPLGGTESRKVDVRVVAATHRNLLQMVDKGTFRADLYYRLAGVQIELLPLRARPEDIEFLFFRLLAREGHADFVPSTELLAHLHSHAWPGNVRELHNFVQRVVSGAAPHGAKQEDETQAFKEAKDGLIEAFTRQYFTQLYEKSGGKVAEVARISGLARPWVHEVLRRLGLHGPKE